MLIAPRAKTGPELGPFLVPRLCRSRAGQSLDPASASNAIAGIGTVPSSGMPSGSPAARAVPRPSTGRSVVAHARRRPVSTNAR